MCIAVHIIVYLLIIPVQLLSIFLKRAVDKKDGSLHTSLVTDLNSASQQNNYSSTWSRGRGGERKSYKRNKNEKKKERPKKAYASHHVLAGHPYFH